MLVELLFGLRDTAAFRASLKEKNIENARAWLKYIVEHKNLFPQYQETWDGWLADRQRELTEAEEE